MKKLLTTTFLGMMIAMPAMANETSAEKNAALDLARTAETIREENAYNYEFERDEQCQGYYWGVKRLGIENPCAKDDEEQPARTSADVTILNEYVVYFDFDRSDIRERDENVLRRAALEISKYNPSRVLVSGHTDTEGDMGYNQRLSERRANAVSQYLTDLGVSNFVVDQEAEGERDLAIPTGDSVRMQQNRRVVIQFVE